MTDRDIEEIAGLNARRIMVIVLCAGGRNLHQVRPVLRCRAETGRANRGGGRGMHAPAKETGLELLIRGQTGKVADWVGAIGPIVAVTTCARYRPCDQAAIVPPVEANP